MRLCKAEAQVSLILVSNPHFYLYLSRNSTETLIHAFVLSRLDYCNSLLYGLPQARIDKIQRVQNAATRLIFKQPKFSHITPVLYSFTGFQLSIVLNLKFCSLPLKLFTAWHLIKSVNWSVENHQLDIRLDPAKELCLRFLVARSSQHLEEEHFVMQPRTSGTICPLKYLASTHSPVLSATSKHIFLNKLLICKSYIFYFC